MKSVFLKQRADHARIAHIQHGKRPLFLPIVAEPPPVCNCESMGGVRQGRACAGGKWKAGSYAGSPVVHCGGADSRVRRNAADLNRPPLKWYAPIASVAAVTAQPLTALPPYGCGVPLAGASRKDTPTRASGRDTGGIEPSRRLCRHAGSYLGGIGYPL